jgi:hypothetical protein
MSIPYEKLSKQQQSMVDSAVEIAQKSRLTVHIGSILYNSGIKIIANCNQHGDSIQDPNGSYHNVCAIHAEMRVCLEYYHKFQKEKKNFRDIRKLILCVVRRNNNGTIRNAKPCMECTAFLKKWLPCKILYSTDDGFCFEKIRDLESDHLSFVQMKRRRSPQGRLSKNT